MALETPLWMGALPGDAPIQYSMRQMRTLIDALVPTEGVCAAGDFRVSPRAAGANLSIDVATGHYVIRGDSQTGQGKYVGRSTAIENRSIPAAPPSGTRHHLVALQIHDRQVDGGATYTADVVVLADPGSGRPGVPLSAIALADVAVAAGQSSVTAANITDLRQRARGIDQSTFTDPARPAFVFTGAIGDTDSSGYITVRHNLGRQPAGAMFTGNDPNSGTANIPAMCVASLVVGNSTATTIKVRVVRTDGRALVSANVLISGIVW